ncbi:MAG: hypothetical protein IAG13_14240 [Deltaproteobacteria bacterium]|nr:hypothetical protein [Nannocystaceae bacterium]
MLRAGVLVFATTLYLANCALGIAAQLTGRGFGRLHHALYAAVFASAIAATVWSFHLALLVTLVALTVFPRARPGTLAHPLLAGVGALGYLGAWIGS